MSLVYEVTYSEPDNALAASGRDICILANNIEAATAAAHLVISRRVNRRDYVLQGIQLVCEIDTDAT